MCLTKIQLIFANNDFIDIFGEESRFPDEHYFINIINMFGMKYTNKRLTYVNWKEKVIYHYTALYQKHILSSPIRYYKMRDSGCVC